MHKQTKKGSTMLCYVGGSRNEKDHPRSDQRVAQIFSAVHFFATGLSMLPGDALAPPEASAQYIINQKSHAGQERKHKWTAISHEPS